MLSIISEATLKILIGLHRWSWNCDRIQSHHSRVAGCHTLFYSIWTLVVNDCIDQYPRILGIWLSQYQDRIGFAFAFLIVPQVSAL